MAKHKKGEPEPDGGFISSEQNGAVSTFYFNAYSGLTFTFLLQSDIHFDSIYCNRELFFEHLDKAVKCNAQIHIFGDFFDAMQGRFDPRRSMAELRPEYRREDYYDFVVKDSVRLLQPYAKHIAMISDGNHELAVLKNANTNLADRLVSHLNAESGMHIQHGGYGGWERLMFNLESGKEPGQRKQIRIKYFHGAGAEAPVTRGVIQTNRQAVYLPDADIVINGHNHNGYIVPISRERLTQKGRQYCDTAYHVRIPGYKQEYGNGSTGWAVTRGGVPKPIGAVWLYLNIKTITFPSRGCMIQPNLMLDVQGAEPVRVSPDVYQGKVFEEDGEGEGDE